MKKLLVLSILGLGLAIGQSVNATPVGVQLYYSGGAYQPVPVAYTPAAVVPCSYCVEYPYYTPMPYTSSWGIGFSLGGYPHHRGHFAPAPHHRHGGPHHGGHRR